MGVHIVKRRTDNHRGERRPVEGRRKDQVAAIRGENGNGDQSWNARQNNTNSGQVDRSVCQGFSVAIGMQSGRDQSHPLIAPRKRKRGLTKPFARSRLRQRVSQTGLSLLPARD